jgi:hypothetical protein
VDWLKFIGFSKGITLAYYSAVAINKIYRIIRLSIDSIFHKRRIKIYACHGACLFIGYKAAHKIGLPYNEEMFLFHEEEHIARVVYQKKISMIFIKDIEIKHFEDGSSVDIKKSGMISKYMNQSYLVYYNYWKDNR